MGDRALKHTQLTAGMAVMVPSEVLLPMREEATTMALGFAKGGAWSHGQAGRPGAGESQTRFPSVSQLWRQPGVHRKGLAVRRAVWGRPRALREGRFLFEDLCSAWRILSL